MVFMCVCREGKRVTEASSEWVCLRKHEDDRRAHAKCLDCLGRRPTGGRRGRCLLLVFFIISFSSPATLQLHAGKIDEEKRKNGQPVCVSQPVLPCTS